MHQQIKVLTEWDQSVEEGPITKDDETIWPLRKDDLSIKGKTEALGKIDKTHKCCKKACLITGL